MKTSLTIFVGAGWLLTSALATGAYADQVVDDFESYQHGQIIGLTAISSPWRRFGGATNDNITVNAQEQWQISGTNAALYGVVWPNPFGAIRRAFEAPTDLSPFAAVSIKMRSDRVGGHTQARLAISNGPTTYVSIASAPVDRETRGYVFELGRTKMVCVNGTDSYDTVITSVWNAGFDFHNNEDEQTETIVIDDFMLLDSVPEIEASPATASK